MPFHDNSHSYKYLQLGSLPFNALKMITVDLTELGIKIEKKKKNE